MWIAAHYDIHGKLPALEAVLDDVHRANASAVAVASPDMDEIVAA